VSEVTRKPYERRDPLVGLLFVGPQVLGFFAFVVFPIVLVLWFSLHDFNLVFGTFEFLGLENYERLLSDPVARTVMVNTLVFTAGYVPLNVGLGLAAALFVNGETRSKRWLRAAFFLPVIVSLPAWTIVWRFILQPSGALNAAISGVGGPELEWLRNPTLAMSSVIIVQALKTFGLAMVFFLGALQGVPRHLEEAATIDGASRWQMVRNVILPLIAPFTFLVIVLTIIDSFKTFSLIFLMTNGGPGYTTTVLSYYVYDRGFIAFEQGYAAAISTLLFAIILVVTVVQFAIRRRWVFQEGP